MSLAEACGWSLLRSLLLALFCLPVCRLLVPVFLKSDGQWNRQRAACLLVPFLMPELLVGYVYANNMPFLVRFPVLNELAYVFLLAFKYVPAGTLAISLSPPPPVSAAALVCRSLAFPTATNAAARMRALVGFWIRGPVRDLAPAFGLMFVLFFQEFEIASLLQITVGARSRPVSWTVTLFELHIHIGEGCSTRNPTG